MRKIQLLLLVLVLVAFASCKKNEAPNQESSKKYVNAIAGTFIAHEGDVSFKAAPDKPLGDGHDFLVLKQGVSPVKWVNVDGSEFITGSAAQLDWAAGALNNHVWHFGYNETIHNTYCPVMPLRFVVKTTMGTEARYLGIYDCTPNAADFPVNIYCKRLGDVLTINRSGLMNIPNYNFTISVTSTFSAIDLPATIQNSKITTASTIPGNTADWFELSYGATSLLSATFLPTTPVPSNPDEVIYNGFDKKITGAITISIVDATNGVHMTQTFPALPVGQRYAFTLVTKDKGWYQSGNDQPMTDDDLQINSTTVNVDANTNP